MPPSSETKRFNKGPNIAVLVVMEDGCIKSSSLAIASSFECIGADAAVMDWLEAYSEGRASPFPLFQGSPFQKKALQAISSIAFGKVITYQELANMCGCPNGARAAGNACGKNPFPLFVPCHRVIRSDGSLGGFAGDIEIKKRLLDFEKRAL